MSQIEERLRALRLQWGVALSLEDPFTGQLITFAYENLHALLMIDLENVPTEAQLVSNIYAEVGRAKKAAEYAADRAGSRFAQWKADRSEEFRARREKEIDAEQKDVDAFNAKADLKKDHRKVSLKAATGTECEGYYRTHKDYERMSAEESRLRAVAGTLHELQAAFFMKSQHLRQAHEQLNRYEGVQGAERTQPTGWASTPESDDRALAYRVALAEEAAAIIARGAASLAAENVSGTAPPVPEPKKTARRVGA